MQAKLSKKAASIQWIEHTDFASWAACPYCQEAMTWQGASLICSNGHLFDLTKQGYFFLSRKALKATKYDQALFIARRQMIQESKLYEPLYHYLISNIKISQNTRILDAGAGEGSHLWRLIQAFRIPVQAIAADLAKDGIQLATDFNGQMLALVADLACLPLQDQSLDMVLNILSPSNYQEFLRVLKPGGRLIKVIPGPDYLMEIRQTAQALGMGTYQPYDNQVVLAAFNHHFPLGTQKHIKQMVAMTDQEKTWLLDMTPLTWQLSDQDRESLLLHLPDEISLDLVVLQGEKSN